MIHSFSSMSTWAKCPRRYKAQYVERSVKDIGSEATRKGEIVHKEIEDYLKGIREAPPAIRPPDGFVEALRLLPEGMVQPERPMAVDHDLKPCDFWSRGALLRGKLDVVVSLGDVLLAVDWKTGKRRKQDTDLQAKVYSVLLRSAYPDREVHIVFDYLNNGRDPVIEAKPEDTNAVLSVIVAIEEDKSYPPVPTPLCAWCPVTTCEFNRKG